MSSLEAYEAKLQTLRNRYLKEPNKRPIIQRQARMLQIAIEKKKKKLFQEEKESVT